MEEIVGLTESPEEARSTFLDVVQNLFEWDADGRGMRERGRGVGGEGGGVTNSYS